MGRQMINHWRNLRYLCIHKYYVFKYGLKLKVPWLQLLIHDWTKLTPFEWFTDARHHYGNRVPGEFLRGRLHHIRWNPHHWQYWVLPSDEHAKPRLVKIPDRFIREMVADWIAAGLAKGEREDARQWYETRKQHIHIHGDSRAVLEKLLKELFPNGRYRKGS